MLTLILLGDLRLERDGVALLTGRRKPLALLAFLSRRGTRSSSREELASLLWGTTDDAGARKSLRQCLSDLRGVDGLSFAESEAGIGLTPEALSSDVDRFEEDIRRGDWRQAVARWRGDCIPAGESLGGSAWQHWLDGERAALRRQLVVAFDHLTSDAERRGDWRAALEMAARWREQVPDDSRGWCREIHALQATGRITDAVARASEGERYFRTELGTAVPDDLARLSRVLSRVGEVSGTPAASLLTPDMMGRANQMEALARARVEARVGAVGQSVLVIAAEGLGKTRLVREFARSTRTADRNAVLVDAAANPADQARPFSFLQAIVGQLAAQDAVAGCAPETLATLAAVAPALRTTFRHLPSSGSGDVAGAFRSVLAEVGRDASLVLLLDDLPDADAESQAVIASTLLSPVAGTLCVATGRPESWQASAALARVSARTDVEHCLLEPLDPSEARAMLASMAPLRPATLDELTTTLHRQSAGIPGLLGSALTNLVIGKVLKPDETGTWTAAAGSAENIVPPTIEERWRARYGAMSAEQRTVVDAAAVLCSAAPARATGLQELENLAAIEPEPFRAAVESLRVAGVLRIHDGRTWFSADFFRQLAHDTQAPSRRRAMHSRAARQLRWTDDAITRATAASHRRFAGSRISTRAVATAFAAAGILAAVAWFGTRDSAARVPARTPVLLADVQNLTGDTTFDQTLYLVASVGLQQSRQVSLFPRSRIRETLALMRRPGADSVLDEALAREIAVRENLRRVVHLSLARVNENYLVAGRVIDPSSGNDLLTHQERVRDRSEVLDALDRVLNRIRRGVGEPADSIAASASLPRVTTASLPALKAYANALRSFTARRYEESRASYHIAVELDSTFALAWLGLADLHFQMGTDRSATYAALAMAERHSERLSERERIRLLQASAGYRGNAEEELRNAEVLARSYPETITWYNLGNMQMRRRRCPEAIASFRNALGFDSSFVAAHINVATCHQFLGASDQAARAYNRAWSIDSLSVYQGGINHEFGVALVRGGQADSALNVYTRMSRRPGLLDQQFGHRSLGYHAAWMGRWRASSAQFDTAALRAREVRVSISEFRNRILQADVLLTAHQLPAARQALDEAWSLRERTAIAPAFAMYAGLAFVRAGQLERADGMLRTIETSMVQASSDDRTVRAILAARIAMARNRLAVARTELKSATDTTRSDYTLPALIDVMLASGHPDSALIAATQFEGRAVFGIDAQDAWIRNLLVKARVAEQLGHTEEATTAYGRLETQLKSGDADHPLLIESRRGLARLAVGDGRRR